MPLFKSKEEKEAKKAAEEAKRQEKIRQLEEKLATGEAKLAAGKAKSAELAEKKAEINAHNKQVIKDTFSDIKQIRQEGKQRRLNIINDAIHDGRIARGEEGLYQNTPAQNAPVQNDLPQNNIASELQKFKQLADDGLITAEEFEAKRKQLLGL